jgi:hypothetical protein
MRRRPFTQNFLQIGQNVNIRRFEWQLGGKYVRTECGRKSCSQSSKVQCFWYRNQQQTRENYITGSVLIFIQRARGSRKTLLTLGGLLYVNRNQILKSRTNQKGFLFFSLISHVLFYRGTPTCSRCHPVICEINFSPAAKIHWVFQCAVHLPICTQTWHFHITQ